MKSAFPTWLKRFDPLLHAEDTNAVYQAFRERRLRKGLKGALQDSIVSRRIFIPVGIAAALLYAMHDRFNLTPAANYAVQATWLVVCAFAFYGLYLTLRRKPARDRRVYLPHRVSDVFQPAAWLHQPAMDLWMTGATGKDIAEALYLEQRERWKIDLVIVLAVFLFSGALILFFIRPIATWGDYLILTLTIVYFIMAPLRAVLKGSAHGRAEIQRRFRMRRQTRTNLRKDTEAPVVESETPQDKREVSQKERKSRRRNLSWILGGFALILVLNFVLLWGLRGSADRLVLYSIFLLIGFANNFYAWVWLPLTEPRYSRLLFQQADRAFTLTMVTAMTEDPDGARWFEQFIQPKPGTGPQQDPDSQRSPTSVP